MGTYIRRVKKSTVRTVEFNGRKVTIAAAEYAYKETFGGPSGLQRGLDERCRNAWHTGEWPTLIADGGYEDSYTVYEGWPEGRCVVKDSFSGLANRTDLPEDYKNFRVAGFIQTTGRGFRVVTEHLGPVRNFRDAATGERYEGRERRFVVDGKFRMEIVRVAPVAA